MLQLKRRKKYRFIIFVIGMVVALEKSGCRVELRGFYIVILLLLVYYFF